MVFTEDGKSPALKTYKSLDAQQRKRLLFLLKRMDDFGRISDKTKFTYEGDQMYAFKPQPERFFSGSHVFLCKRVKLLLPTNLERNNKNSLLKKKRGL
jgi:hypothetical protein